MIKWNQHLGKPECPYMRRWVIDFKLFSIRLHNWISGDDPRHFHDHPWNFIVFVLSGHYYDVNTNGKELMPQWSITKRKAEHKHTVETDGCWTLLFCGPEIRNWGFWTKNKSGKAKWLKANRYFRKNGHHPCK